MSPYRPPNLPSQMRLKLKPDHKGYIGRQCPAHGCRKYFKVKTTTGSLTRSCTGVIYNQVQES